jgi:hypothetical protein
MIDHETAHSASPVEDLLQHALTGVALAQRGIRQAQQKDERELIELFEHALANYNECADAARRRLYASQATRGTRPAEQARAPRSLRATARLTQTSYLRANETEPVTGPPTDQAPDAPPRCVARCSARDRLPRHIQRPAATKQCGLHAVARCPSAPASSRETGFYA